MLAAVIAVDESVVPGCAKALPGGKFRHGGFAVAGINVARTGKCGFQKIFVS
jgi:hypothetical protein